MLQINPRHRGNSEICGVFASHSPHRPNGIGMSIVRLVHIKGNRIEFEGVDMLDGTPVLDIKGYDPCLNPVGKSG